MSERDGGALSQFLAFMEPFKPVAFVEPTRPAWPPPDGEETLLTTSPRSASGVFAGAAVISPFDRGDADEAPRRLLPPAA